MIPLPGEVVLEHASRAFSVRADRGGTLKELLLGRRPYDGEGPMETMDKIRRAEPIDLHELPVDLQALVRRCLAARPADRYSSAEAAREAIAAARRSLPPVGPSA